MWSHGFHVEINCPYPVGCQSRTACRPVQIMNTLVIFALCFRKKNECPSKKMSFWGQRHSKIFLSLFFSNAAITEVHITFAKGTTTTLWHHSFWLSDFLFFLITVMRAPSVVKQKHTAVPKNKKKEGGGQSLCHLDPGHVHSLSVKQFK